MDPALTAASKLTDWCSSNQPELMIDLIFGPEYMIGDRIATSLMSKVSLSVDAA
jgi:hypothetical protein